MPFSVYLYSLSYLHLYLTNEKAAEIKLLIQDSTAGTKGVPSGSLHSAS